MYFVFYGDNYYPGGGVNDLLGKYSSLDDAKSAVMNTRCDWWHITDLNLAIIEKSSRR